MQSMSLKSYLNKTMERWARNCTYKDGEDRISTFISNQSSRWGESFRNHFTPPPIKNRKKKIHQWITMEFSVWKKVEYWGCRLSCLRNWSSSYINQFKGLDYDLFKPSIMQVIKWILPQSCLSSFILSPLRITDGHCLAGCGKSG